MGGGGGEGGRGRHSLSGRRLPAYKLKRLNVERSSVCASVRVYRTHRVRKSHILHPRQTVAINARTLVARRRLGLIGL